MKRFDDVGGWRYAIILGGILLLLGNVLPWPCIGSTSDCMALITYRLDNSLYGLLIVIDMLLIPLEVILLKAPWNYIVWSVFWFLPYLLFIAKIYPVHMGTEVWGYLPLLSANEYLRGPAQLVTPLSLIAFWLAVRPRNLQELWKFGTLVALITLAVITGAFYISMEQEMLQYRLSSTLSSGSNVFGTGPLTIIAGAIILLAVEFYEIFTDRHKNETASVINSVLR